MQKPILNNVADEKYVMELAHTVSAVQLLTLKAVANEKRELGVSFKFANQRNMNYYLLRSKTGKPLVLIVTRDGAVIWCRTAYSRRPKNYISSVVEFIIKQNLDIAADMASTGLVRKNGNYYNVYDLPKDFVYNGDMDLSYAGLEKLPDMSTVTINGNYNVSGNNLTSFYGVPKLVNGNFYAYSNHPASYAQRVPKHVVITGTYYNVKPVLER